MHQYQQVKLQGMVSHIDHLYPIRTKLGGTAPICFICSSSESTDGTMNHPAQEVLEYGKSSTKLLPEIFGFIFAFPSI